MILTGPEIAREVAGGRIAIEPFEPAQVTPTSYDLRLGPTLLHYPSINPQHPVDPAQVPTAETFSIPVDGHVMQAGDFLLGHSVETVGTDHYAALLHARSGVARMGLFVHVTSDLIHTGARGQITFQLYATLPVRLRAGMVLGQLTFWQPRGEIALYRGKYYNQQGVGGSQLYREFEQR